MFISTTLLDKIFEDGCGLASHKAIQVLVTCCLLSKANHCSWFFMLQCRMLHIRRCLQLVGSDLTFCLVNLSSLSSTSIKPIETHIHSFSSCACLIKLIRYNNLYSFHIYRVCLHKGMQPWKVEMKAYRALGSSWIFLDRRQEI